MEVLAIVLLMAVFLPLVAWFGFILVGALWEFFRELVLEYGPWVVLLIAVGGSFAYLNGDTQELPPGFAIIYVICVLLTLGFIGFLVKIVFFD